MTLLEPFFTVLTGGENLIGKKICFCQGVVPWPPVSQLLVSLVRALTSHLSLGLRLPPGLQLFPLTIGRFLRATVISSTSFLQ